jgi:hypothetical protein
VTVATQGGGVGLSADPKSKQRGEQSAESIVLRQFGGVNLQSPREDIGDDEFAWLEELIPIAPGNLALSPGPGTAIITIAGESGTPSYVLPFNVSGTDYVLAIWANSGNAWIGPAATGVGWAKIASALYTSGKTAAAQWNNLGIVIVDPVVGMRDWNITAANTLTNLSGQLYGIAVSAQSTTQLNGSVLPSLRVSDPTGVGGTIGASLSIVSVTVTAGGSGYAVGDVLQFTGGTLTTSSAAPALQQNQPTVLNVTGVDGTGKITGISIASVGYYQTVPGNPVSVTGGSGTLATFTANWAVAHPYIITAGNGYTAPVVQAFIGAVWVAYAMTISTSGTLLGTSVAVYAGRVWVAIGRTVQFTDAGSYSSFANSGSAFTIDDAYLHSGITALFAANNYLYIFGDDSVDILSNVQVVNGIAQFSRINASASIGTTQPLSIFPYLRTIAFANNSGFYIMSGATPEKVSDKLDDLMAATNFTAKIYGAQVMVRNILCGAFLINFTDSFTQTPAVARSVLVVLLRGKWWFTSQVTTNGGQLGALAAVPVAGLSSLYGWSGPTFYPLLSLAANANSWLLKTKLWGAQAPMLDKSGIFAGIGAVLGGAGTVGFDVYVETEKSSVLSTLGQAPVFVQWTSNGGVPVAWVNNFNATVLWSLAPAGYQLFTAQANNGGGKYIGLRATGNNNTTQIRLLALEIERTRRW